MEEKEKIINYVNENFNVEATTLRLIRSVYEYLDQNCHSLCIITYNDNRIAIHDFLYNLLDILQDADIDLTMQELLDNNLIEMECR